MTPADILTRTAELFGVTPQTLAGGNRSRYLAWARQAAMLALHRQGLSYVAIGQLLGGRDHTTVIYGVAAARQRRAEVPTFDQKIAALLGESPDTPTAGENAPSPAVA